MKIGLALTFGILYWLATNKLWYGTLHLVRQPIVLAVPIGLIMGNLPDAMIMGASLQMIYLGAIAPGGTLPSDEALSSCIAIPLALQAGLDPSIAVTLAVPIGLLGVLIDNLKRTYMSFFVHIADKAVEENNVKKMSRAEFWYPLFASVPLRIIPTFLALLLAAWCRCCICLFGCYSGMGNKRTECCRWTSASVRICGYYYGNRKEKSDSIFYYRFCSCCI